MRRPLLLLVVLSLTALAKPTSFEPSITVEETTFEVRGQDLTAHTGNQVLWKHRENSGFHYQDLQVEENHVVVKGVLDDTPFHPQVVLLDLEGQEVARTDGRFLLAEGGHFYMDQLFPRKTVEGLPDIDVVNLNPKSQKQEHWKVKAPVLPEPCLVQGEEPYPFHRFVEKKGERWQFRYFTGRCEVLGTFQEGVGSSRCRRWWRSTLAPPAGIPFPS